MGGGTVRRLRFSIFRGPQMGGQIRRGRIWRFWGAPVFSSEVRNTYFKGFWDLCTENRGAPKAPDSTTTDLTPHLRPSDICRSGVALHPPEESQSLLNFLQLARCRRPSCCLKGVALLSKPGSTPTPCSGPFRDPGLRPWSYSPSEHCKR